MTNLVNKPVTQQELRAKTLVELDTALSKGDFPALSASISRIITSMDGEGDSDSLLVDIILSDFALTQKVLKLANSAMYSAFGEVTTISHAVYILGTESVGHLAMGLKFIDSLDKSADTKNAKEELAKAVLAGSIAKSIGSRISGSSSEIASISVLVKRLGRMLTCVYLPETYKVIIKKAKGAEVSEDKIAHLILGLTFSEVAMHCLKKWNMPETFMEYASIKEPEAGTHKAWLHNVSKYSLEYTDLAAKGNLGDKEKKLASHYADLIGLDSTDLLSLTKTVLIEAQQDAALAAASCTFTQLTDEAINSKNDLSSTEISTSKLSDLAPDLDDILNKGYNYVLKLKEKENLSGSRLATVVMEVLLKGLGAQRASLFLKKKSQRNFELTLGIGKSILDKIGNVKFESDFSPNVVHLSLSKNMPVFLNDLTSPTIQLKTPDWLKYELGAPCSVLLIPLAAKESVIALICLDWDKLKINRSLSQSEFNTIMKFKLLIESSMFTPK